MRCEGNPASEISLSHGQAWRAASEGVLRYKFVFRHVLDPPQVQLKVRKNAAMVSSREYRLKIDTNLHSFSTMHPENHNIEPDHRALVLCPPSWTHLHLLAPSARPMSLQVICTITRASVTSGAPTRVCTHPQRQGGREEAWGSVAAMLNQLSSHPADQSRRIHYRQLFGMGRAHSMAKRRSRTENY